MDAKKNISIIMLLAWRNVWKNKRRTILTTLTIVVGSMMIVLLNAWALGSHDQMIEDAVGLNIGHIQIHEKGFWDNQSLDFGFMATSGLINRLDNLKAEKKIEGYGKRIIAGGLLSFKKTTSGAIVAGVEPGNEKTITVLHKKIIKGRFLNATDKKSVVLGATLAKNLGIAPGDTLAMISQGFDGSIVGENLMVVGLFASGNPEYDQMLALIPFSQASQSFSMMGYITSIVIRLSDIGHSAEITGQLRKFLAAEHNNCKARGNEAPEKCSTHEIMGWNELMPELVQWITMDDFSLYIFDFILYMIVAFGILNTIQMSIFERTRELGIMLAIGTSPGQVKFMVLCESFIITCIGLSAGIILGTVLSIYYQLNPLDFSEYAKEMAAFQVNSTLMPAKLSKENILVTGVLTFVLSFLFTIFPARRAANLEPVVAIRHL